MSTPARWRVRVRARRGAPVECDQVREAISARLDGEDPPIPDELVRSHLVGCAECRDFEANLVSATRLVRLRVLEPVPDLTLQILASLGVPEPMATVVETSGGRLATRHRSDWRRAVQWVAAVVPLATSVPALATGAFDHPRITPSHLATACTFLLTHHVH